MSLPRRISGLAVAALIMAGGLMSASSAKAEDLVDFLWGGSAEYGGGRSVVTFDPKYKPGQVIVSFSDRRLYWITKPGEALTYPVAIPTGEARWQGVTSVTSKRVNPPWTPTPDMVRNNPRLPRWVPGGHPMNPLGIRAMYLGTSAYRIHGTDAPWTIGQAVSHGCIRMTNEDVLDLYPRIPVGTRVTVTWQQFSTRTISNGEGYQRYGDKDSNPRAGIATPVSTQSASAEPASSNASSSESSAYSYRAYGSGKAQSARTVSNQSSGGIENLFFWDQPKQSTAAVEAPAQDQASPDTSKADASNDQEQASRDATKDDDNDDMFAEQNLPSKKKTVAETYKPEAFEKPSKKVHEASTETVDKGSLSEIPKKKAVSTAVPAKKKPTTTAASHVPSVSDPEVSPAMAVPDPVKPSPTKTSEVTPSATNASASSAEVVHVQKASVQVQ
ncbi:L,D-transpeptidase [Hyphomicrobium sp.]|uniref:L,D-transpeptidase n=1 Tax=Hyphomicrobium sp. TaxID=82 RepID=UPI00356391D7